MWEERKEKEELDSFNREFNTRDYIIEIYGDLHESKACLIVRSTLRFRH